MFSDQAPSSGSLKEEDLPDPSAGQAPQRRLNYRGDEIIGIIVMSIVLVVVPALGCGTCLLWQSYRRIRLDKEEGRAIPASPIQQEELRTSGTGVTRGTAIPGLPIQQEELWTSAQWPRRKVANFTLEAGSFEAFGHQYSLQPADEPGTAQFRWGDGTLQISDRIDRNTIWWRTNHPNPDWQRFLWVCNLLAK